MLMFGTLHSDFLKGGRAQDFKEGMIWLEQKGYVDLRGNPNGPYFLTDAGFAAIDATNGLSDDFVATEGHMFKQGFSVLMQHRGGAVTIYRNHGTPEQSSWKARGMKNSLTKDGRDVVFQFSERLDIQEGDVIQQDGAADLWQATETEDEIKSGQYHCFLVMVEKVGKRRSARPTGDFHPASNIAIHVNAPVHGPIQIGRDNASHSSVQTGEVGSAIARLLTAIRQSELNPLEKEELESNANRVDQLSKRDQTEEVKLRALEKLELIEKAIGIGTTLVPVALPLIESIRAFFGR